MSRARVVVGLAVLGLGAFALAAYARQGAADAPAGESTSFDWLTNAFPIDEIAASFSDLNDEVDWQNSMNTQPSVSVIANVSAFLPTIRNCEGTAGQPDPYRVCFAYSHVIADLRDHPAITGEWKGQRLSDVQCGGAGLSPGCITTAAGAYQFTKPTWSRLKSKLRLTDFGPVSQDLAAIQLLRECGAYERLAVGDLAGAVAAARGTWASLPGANYAGQGMRSMSQVTAWYGASGGTTA